MDKPLGVADVMRAQALLLGHLFHIKMNLTRAQHRAIVQDMVDWAIAMDAKEKLVQALAEEATQARKQLAEVKRKRAVAAARYRMAAEARSENPAAVAMRGRAAA